MTASKQALKQTNNNESLDCVNYKMEIQEGSNDIRPNAPSLVQIKATTQLTIMSWAKDSNNHVIDDPVETATEDRSSFVDILLSIKAWISLAIP